MTAKVSDSTSTVTGNSYQYVQAQTLFFASDSASPSGSADSGNRFRLDILSAPGIVTSTGALRTVRGVYDSSGSFNTLSDDLPIALNAPLYVRIYTDGSGNWYSYIGDGLTYRLVGTKSGFLTAPLTIGFTFQIYPNSTSLAQTVAVDFLRIDTSPTPFNLTFGG